MKFINAQQVSEQLDYKALVDRLMDGFAADINVPQRQHYNIPNPQTNHETTLLMMPAWQTGKDIGIKLVTVAPDNAQLKLPSVQGTYVLMDACTGNVRAMIDAPSLTAKRTAAASALASQFLSSPLSETLLMVGTGTLAPHLIKAHCQVRQIKRVLIWGRDPGKAWKIKQRVHQPDLEVTVFEDLGLAVSEADIISVATLSSEPLINGSWLKPGQHLDLVGSYRPDMREADNQCITRSRIFVDNHDTAIKESGDLTVPLFEGIMTENDVEADLFSLCKRNYKFSRQKEDVTLFKSVGHALEDLVAAQLLYSKLEQKP